MSRSIYTKGKNWAGQEKDDMKGNRIYKMIKQIYPLVKLELPGLLSDISKDAGLQAFLLISRNFCNYLYPSSSRSPLPGDVGPQSWGSIWFSFTTLQVLPWNWGSVLEAPLVHFQDSLPIPKVMLWDHSKWQTSCLPIMH